MKKAEDRRGCSGSVKRHQGLKGNKSYPYWYAQIWDYNDRRQLKKCFSVGKHGEEEAKRLAQEHLQKLRVEVEKRGAILRNTPYRKKDRPNVCPSCLGTGVKNGAS